MASRGRVYTTAISGRVKGQSRAAQVRFRAWVVRFRSPEWVEDIGLVERKLSKFCGKGQMRPKSY